MIYEISIGAIEASRGDGITGAEIDEGSILVGIGQDDADQIDTRVEIKLIEAEFGRFLDTDGFESIVGDNRSISSSLSPAERSILITEPDTDSPTDATGVNAAGNEVSSTIPIDIKEMSTEIGRSPSVIKRIVDNDGGRVKLKVGTTEVDPDLSAGVKIGSIKSNPCSGQNQNYVCYTILIDICDSYVLNHSFNWSLLLSLIDGDNRIRYDSTITDFEKSKAIQEVSIIVNSHPRSITK